MAVSDAKDSMNFPFSIRRLTPSDLVTMRSMLSMMGEAFDDRLAYEGSPPGDAWLRRLLARDSFIAIVATEGDVVRGGIAAYVLEKFEQERSEIYIYDLAVAESHRRQGIASALIAEVQRIAAAIGAWVVFVQADHGDDPAIALYARLGVREDVLHFDLPPLP
jgi:aminoglycoside 3-N-acetyltransferase I